MSYLKRYSRPLSGVDCNRWGPGAYALARTLKRARVITGGPCLDNEGPPGISGVTSQARGPRVYTNALSGLTSQARGPRVHSLVLGSLGDAAPNAAIDPSAPSVDPQAAWRQDMLASSREVASWQKQWVQKDELQRWIQIGATLCIPLAGAIWRLILRRD